MSDEYKLFLACNEGDLDKVKYLIEVVPPEVEDNMPLRIAAAAGHLDIVMFLCEQPSVSPNDENNDALHGAKDAGHEMVVGYLMTFPRVQITEFMYQCPGASDKQVLQFAKSILKLT